LGSAWAASLLLAASALSLRRLALIGHAFSAGGDGGAWAGDRAADMPRLPLGGPSFSSLRRSCPAWRQRGMAGAAWPACTCLFCIPAHSPPGAHSPARRWNARGEILWLHLHLRVTLFLGLAVEEDVTSACGALAAALHLLPAVASHLLGILQPSLRSLPGLSSLLPAAVAVLKLLQVTPAICVCLWLCPRQFSVLSPPLAFLWQLFVCFSGKNAITLHLFTLPCAAAWDVRGRITPVSGVTGGSATGEPCLALFSGSRATFFACPQRLWNCAPAWRPYGARDRITHRAATLPCHWAAAAARCHYALPSMRKKTALL